METLHGWTVRRIDGSARLALNVKVHRGATAEELRDVAEGNGEDPAAFAAWWNEETSGNGSEALRDAEELAVSDSYEMARESAEELFGKAVRVYSDGRSSGWLYLDRGPDVDDVRAAIEQVSAELDPADEDPTWTASERADAAALLAKLDSFREQCAAAVADFPRRVAWQACANVYAHERAERERAEKVMAAEARLALATSGLRNRVSAVTLHMGAGFGFVVDELVPALAEYDATRAALAELESAGE